MEFVIPFTRLSKALPKWHVPLGRVFEYKENDIRVIVYAPTESSFKALRVRIEALNTLEPEPGQPGEISEEEWERS